MATSPAEARVVLTAVDNASRVFSTVRHNLSGLGTSIATVKGAIAGLGAVAGVAYLANMARETQVAIDGFNDLSDATGSSIENVSALDRVARATGGTFEQVSSILVKFNQVLKDADPKSGAASVFKSLNLDLAELKRLDPAEALRRTAVALSGFADDGNKARAVQELFGKSVKDAAPFLKDLAESGQLVGTVSKESAEEVDRFNKQLAQLQANATDAGRSLSIGLITEINRVIDRFKEGQKEGKSFLEIIFTSNEEMKRRFAQAAGTVGVEQRLDTVRQLKEAESRLRQFEDRSLAGSPAYEAALAKRKQDVESLRTRLRAIDGAGNPFDQSGAETARLKRLNDGQTPAASIGDVTGGTKGPEKPKAKDPFSGLTYDEQITQSVGRLFEDSDITKAQVYADTLKKLDELFFSGAIGADLYDSAMKRLNGSTSAGADETSDFVDQQKRLKDLLADKELEAQRKDMELLTAALERGQKGLEGGISEVEYLDAISRRLGLVGGQLKEVKGFAEEFGLTFSSAMEDAIVKGGSFRDVLDGVEQDLARIVIRKSVTEPLGNAISSFNWGSLFANANGNVFANAPGLSAYSSTVVNQPTLFPFARGMGLMGEAGPEAIMPLQRLANGKLGVGVAGGGAPSVKVEIITPAGTPVRVASQSQTQGANGETVVRFFLEAVGDALANRTGPVARGLEAGYGLG